MHLEAPEFIKKVMEGERDFTGVRLTDVDVAGDVFTFLELSDYLQKQDLKKQPIILNDAELEHIRAGQLWMPYLKAQRTSFKNAYFLGANFQFSNFSRSSFFNTDLQNANCQNCDFSSAYFKSTTLNKTQLKQANFKFSDLTGVKDLREAIDLALAQFSRTTVGPVEEKAILAAIQANPQTANIDVTQLFRKRG